MTGSVFGALAKARAQSQPNPAGEDKAELVSEQPKNTADDADGKLVMTAAEFAAAEAAATTAERDRIRAILNADAAAGRQALAAHLALETDMTADVAATLLEKSPKEASTSSTPHPLDTVMKAANLPEPPDATGADDAGNRNGAKGSRAVENWRTATGHAAKKEN